MLIPKDLLWNNSATHVTNKRRKMSCNVNTTLTLAPQPVREVHKKGYKRRIIGQIFIKFHVFAYEIFLQIWFNFLLLLKIFMVPTNFPDKPLNISQMKFSIFTAEKNLYIAQASFHNVELGQIFAATVFLRTCDSVAK